MRHFNELHEFGKASLTFEVLDRPVNFWAQSYGLFAWRFDLRRRPDRYLPPWHSGTTRSSPRI